MNEKEIVVNLISEKRKIESQIESLKRDLEAIERLLAKYKNDEGKTYFLNGPIYETMKPTEAVLEMFEENPYKEWKSTEIATRLKEMIDNKIVISSAKDVSFAARTIIRSLIKKGIVEKIDVLGGKRYRKINKAN